MCPQLPPGEDRAIAADGCFSSWPCTGAGMAHNPGDAQLWNSQRSCWASGGKLVTSCSSCPGAQLCFRGANGSSEVPRSCERRNQTCSQVSPSLWDASWLKVTMEVRIKGFRWWQSALHLLSDSTTQLPRRNWLHAGPTQGSQSRAGSGAHSQPSPPKHSLLQLRGERVCTALDTCCWRRWSEHGAVFPPVSILAMLVSMLERRALMGLINPSHPLGYLQVEKKRFPPRSEDMQPKKPWFFFLITEITVIHRISETVGHLFRRQFHIFTQNMCMPGSRRLPAFAHTHSQLEQTILITDRHLWTSHGLLHHYRHFTAGHGPKLSASRTETLSPDFPYEDTHFL